MELNFLTVLLTVLSLILLAVPGFLLAKTKVLGDKAENALSSVVLYGLQPALMFMSFQKVEYKSEIALNMLIVAGLTCAIHIIMIVLMSLVFRGKTDKKSAVVKFGSVFSNCGYMGMPFLMMLFPDNGEILIYAGIIMSIFNVFNWTVGVYFFTNKKSDMSLKKVILNPVIIGILLGIIVFFIFKKPLADICVEGSFADNLITKIMTSVKYLADSVTPCSMIVIGIKLSKVSIKKLLLDKSAYITAIFKLVVMSLFTMLLVVFLPIDNVVKYVMFFLMSMPSASGTTMFAVQFGGDAETGSVVVLLTTMLSILTIPLLYLLFGVLI